jgi:hypothetical protein
MTFAALVALFPSYAPQLDHATPPMSWPRLVMFYGGELGDERRVIARHEDRPAGARSGVDG